MVYVPNSPQGSEKPSVSRAQIELNFTELNTQYGSDHVAFDAGTNNGKHQKSTYVAYTGSPPPDPSTGAGDLALYAKTISGNTELYLRQVSSGAVIQMTKGTLLIAGNATGTSQGRSFLPGGLIIQWGSLTATTGGTAFTFSTPFTAIYSLVGGIQAAGAQAVAFASVTVAGATVYSASGSQEINYIALGV